MKYLFARKTLMQGGDRGKKFLRVARTRVEQQLNASLDATLDAALNATLERVAERLDHFFFENFAFLRTKI